VEIGQRDLDVEAEALIDALLDQLLIIDPKDSNLDVYVPHVHYLLRPGWLLRVRRALLRLIVHLCILAIRVYRQVHHDLQFVEVDIFLSILLFLVEV
jgi:hypothetical protein